MTRRWLDFAPDALAVIAEGAWVSAVYALVQAAARAPLTLGPIPFAIAAAAGLIAARRLVGRTGERWPRVALGLVATAAVVGWLLEPTALSRLLALDPEGALRAHPGGVLAGVAFLRGYAYATPAGSEEVLERLLGLGLPALAIPVLLTGTLSEPWRSLALERELVAAVVFLVSATVGVALGRVAGIARATGFDWRRNRAWLALVGLLALGVVAVAVPASLAITPALRVALAALVAPLILVGAVAGIAQVRVRQVVGLGLLLGTVFLIGIFATGRVRPTDEEGGAGIGTVTGGDSPVVNAAGGLLILLLIVLGILLLARLWMRDAARPGGPDVAEERTIDRRPEVAERSGAGRRGGRGRSLRPAPVDATGAYLALLFELESRPSARREVAESPAAHARRLRAAGVGAPGLDLLAADYELARFAGRRLSAAEERRAISRWARLRRSLGLASSGPGRAERAGRPARGGSA